MAETVDPVPMGLSARTVGEAARTERLPERVRAMIGASESPADALIAVAQYGRAFDEPLLRAICRTPSGLWAVAENEALPRNLAPVVLDAATEMLRQKSHKGSPWAVIKAVRALVVRGFLPSGHPIGLEIERLIDLPADSRRHLRESAATALETLVLMPDCPSDRLVQWMETTQPSDYTLAYCLARPNVAPEVLAAALMLKSPEPAIARAQALPSLLDDQRVESAYLAALRMLPKRSRALAAAKILARASRTPEQATRRTAWMASHWPAETAKWLMGQPHAFRTLVDPSALQSLLAHRESAIREAALTALGRMGPASPRRRSR